MQGKSIEEAVAKVINPACPWKLPQLDWSFPSYCYKMSRREWKALLAKAEQGDGKSEFGIAEHYSDGVKDRSGAIVVKPSARKYSYWLRRAAEHGCSSAWNNLGVRLTNHKSVEADWREGIDWLKKAYRDGDTCCAPVNIAVTYRQQGEFRKAVAWFRKVVASGDDGARIQFGVHLYWGIGVSVDHKAAVEHFRRATRGKNISEAERDDAYFYLGVAYLEGKGVKASIAEARRLLERANVDDDHLAARRLLARL
ncbi:MAG TPA: tetratricopeptide repeat protein [Terracidiphilus sp.]|nr:tetratricopeptide repeat protein [Terracidiphilus sp.]